MLTAPPPLQHAAKNQSMRVHCIPHASEAISEVAMANTLVFEIDDGSMTFGEQQALLPYEMTAASASAAVDHLLEVLSPTEDTALVSPKPPPPPPPPVVAGPEASNQSRR